MNYFLKKVVFVIPAIFSAAAYLALQVFHLRAVESDSVFVALRVPIAVAQVLPA
jgi:hypothetical protein